jgi:formylglycine-generating enzyme required for sulfatase activity
LGLHAGNGLRLPTEAEWEYACRAGTTGDYNVEGANLDELGWYERNSAGTTHPVGRKKPNAWGLRDCHGNVWEWCQDWYGDYPNGPVTDPEGPEQATYRVIRGGGWDGGARNCRSACRFWGTPGNRSSDLGFRPVLTLASK